MLHQQEASPGSPYPIFCVFNILKLSSLRLKLTWMMGPYTPTGSQVNPVCMIIVIVKLEIAPTRNNYDSERTR